MGLKLEQSNVQRPSMLQQAGASYHSFSLATSLELWYQAIAC